MINDASVVIGGGNWGIKEADVLGYKLINDEYYARDIDFANSTAAGTYTDSTGVIRKAPYNLLLQSNTFSTTWATALSTVTIGQIGYDGTSNAWLLEKSNTDGRIGQSITLPTGAYTYSVYAKAGTKNWVLLRVDGASNRTAYFNLQTGVTGTATGCTSSISSVGDGWYRCSITYTDAITIVRIYVADANNDTSGTSGNILIQSAQLVEGTEALPYFPTTTRLNVPRIDYRNADGSLSTVGRLLLEPQRTNLALYSDQFNDATWTKVAVSVTANTITSPDGTTNADTVTANGVTTSHSFFQTISGGTVKAISIYAKAGTHQFLQILTGGTANPVANYDIVNGTSNMIGSSSTSSIENVGNGWYRCILSTTDTGATNPTFAFAGSLSSPRNPSVSTSGTMYIWGCQVEAGAYPTTYIPTTTAAVTRNADVASKTGVSSWIGQTEGSIFINVNFNPLSTNRDIIYLGDSSNAFRIVFSAGNAITVGVRTASTSVNYISTGTLAAGTYKIGFGYKSGDHVLYINGTQVGVSTSTSMPVGTLSSISLGNPVINGPIEQPLAQAAIFLTRLTNEQLSQLTTL